MERNNLTCTESGIIWHQIARNKDEAKLKERSVQLPSDIHRAVSDFAEFSVEAGGDRYSSIGTAMNEINSQSRELVEKLYEADREDEVENLGKLANAAISLFKALEAYYVFNFSPLRSGTLGD